MGPTIDIGCSCADLLMGECSIIEEVPTLIDACDLERR